MMEDFDEEDPFNHGGDLCGHDDDKRHISSQHLEEDAAACGTSFGTSSSSRGPENMFTTASVVKRRRVEVGPPNVANERAAPVVSNGGVDIGATFPFFKTYQSMENAAKMQEAMTQAAIAHNLLADDAETTSNMSAPMLRARMRELAERKEKTVSPSLEVARPATASSHSLKASSTIADSSQCPGYDATAELLDDAFDYDVEFDGDISAGILDIIRNGNAQHKVPLLLGPSRTGQLKHLPVSIVERLFFIYPICPAFFKHPDRFIKGVLSAHSYVCKVSPQGPLQTEIPVVVVSGCTGTGCPLEVVRNGLDMLNQECGKIKFRIVKVMSYEVNPEATQISQCVRKGYPADIEDMGDLVNFHTHVDKHLKPFFERSKIIMLAGTECTNTTPANKNQPAVEAGTSLLHAEHGRTIWHWYHGCYNCVKGFGKSNAVHIHEYPECSSKDDDHVVWQLLCLFRLSTDGADWNSAKRYRKWCTSPYTHTLKAQVLPAKPQWTQPCQQRPDPEGYVWAPGTASKLAGGPPIVLRRYYPILVEKAHMKGNLNGFTDFERQTLDSLQVGLGSLRKHAGVFFYLNNLGMDDTRLAQVMDLNPCLKFITAKTGEAVAASHPEASRCGVKVFCNTCFEALRILGGAWHYRCALEVFLRTMKCAVENWKEDKEIHRWHHWTKTPHECGPECPQKPSWSK